MKYTYKEILESLPIKKNSNSSWWVKLLIRKLSFPFTYAFINLGFSPNSVSILSIFIALISFICFSIQKEWTLVMAIVCINLWLILDCVDGNIARCKKQKTIYGEFVDDIGGYYVVAFVYLAISVQAYYTGSFIKNNIYIIIIGAISSISDILARLINKDYINFSTRRLDYILTDYTNESKKSLSYIRRRIGKEVGISGAFMPLTILCGIFSLYDIMTLFYCAFNVFALISTTAIYIYKATKYDKEHS